MTPDRAQRFRGGIAHLGYAFEQTRFADVLQ
jgi:hypothetical protein